MFGVQPAEESFTIPIVTAVAVAVAVAVAYASGLF